MRVHNEKEIIFLRFLLGLYRSFYHVYMEEYRDTKDLFILREARKLKDDIDLLNQLLGDG